MKEKTNELPELNNGHAWLLKWLFGQFKVDGFSYDPDSNTFEGNGIGVKVEQEAENVRRWFFDLVTHGAIAAANPEVIADGWKARDVVWQVRALPNVTETGTSLDTGIVMDKLVSEFVEVIPASRIEGAACVVIKGEGAPPELVEGLRTAFIARGARKDLLIVQIPEGATLHVLPEKQMRAAGWVRKPRVWTPGQK